MENKPHSKLINISRIIVIVGSLIIIFIYSPIRSTAINECQLNTAEALCKAQGLEEASLNTGLFQNQGEYTCLNENHELIQFRLTKKIQDFCNDWWSRQ